MFQKCIDMIHVAYPFSRLFGYSRWQRVHTLEGGWKEVGDPREAESLLDYSARCCSYFSLLLVKYVFIWLLGRLWWRGWRSGWKPCWGNGKYTPFYRNVWEISGGAGKKAWFDDRYYLAMNEWNYAGQVIVSQVVAWLYRSCLHFQLWTGEGHSVLKRNRLTGLTLQSYFQQSFLGSTNCSSIDWSFTVSLLFGARMLETRTNSSQWSQNHLFLVYLFLFFLQCISVLFAIVVGFSC